MLLSSLVLMLAAATPSVALQNFNAPGMKAEQVALLTNYFAASLRREGLKVITNDEIAAVLGLERQRQLLSCTDSSCMTELGAALGVDAVVLGQVGAIGTVTTVLAKVVSTKTSEVLAESTDRVVSGTTLDEALDRVARVLASGLLPRAPQQRSVGSRLAWPLLTGGLGVAALAVGAVMMSQVAATASLVRNSMTLGAAETFAARGKTEQTVAVGLFIGGGLACAVGVVLAVLGFSDPPAVAGWLTDSQGGFTLESRW
ncbi:MAG: hypothetical protein ABTQ32_04645 [Myxococcaceae bacterium]